ncbi:MAG: hypothetical protein ACFFCZ_17025 [Promethearchaeota archaeon]
MFEYFKNIRENLRVPPIFIISLIFLNAAVSAYFYGFITSIDSEILIHPFRSYSIPLGFFSLFFLILAIVMHFVKKELNNLEKPIKLYEFMCLFIFLAFLMKILACVIHEVFGHGIATLLTGGKIKSVYISIFWPYEFSYITTSTVDATRLEMAFLKGAGILVCLTVAYIILLILVWQKPRWYFSLPLFWLSFWCWINETSYLMIGGIYILGDAGYLIKLGVLTRVSSILLGIVLFIIGLFYLSEVVYRILAPFLKEKSKNGVVGFWLIVPILVLLLMLGQGMFHIVFLIISFIPAFLTIIFQFKLKDNVENQQLSSTSSDMIDPP